MFSKINKKVLIIAAIVIVVILLAVFGVYKYRTDFVPPAGNYNADSQAVQEPTVTPLATSSPSVPTPQVQIQPGDIQIEGSGAGSFSICLDRCGDNICQTTDPNCTPDNTMNCVCPETHKSCPNDCK